MLLVLAHRSYYSNATLLTVGAEIAQELSNLRAIMRILNEAARWTCELELFLVPASRTWLPWWRAFVSLHRQLGLIETECFFSKDLADFMMNMLILFEPASGFSNTEECFALFMLQDAYIYTSRNLYGNARRLSSLLRYDTGEVVIAT